MNQERNDVVLLNRVLVAEGILDAFGHASVRSAADPGRFFLSRSHAPELVEERDVLEFDMKGDPVEPTKENLYSERFIHSEIYKLRPDVMTICHHHAPAILPFCLTDLALKPVTQLGATTGWNVPMWDSRKKFGATNHLVTNADEGRDLAEALGEHHLVLMRRHGATLVASNPAELAFRVVYSAKNAENLYRASLLGKVDCFTEEETRLAGQFRQASIQRGWNLWTRKLGLNNRTSN
jgi:ribulose-5-phosphate 4-epimerase/fuculose-1-phosphate aldolase